MASRFRLVNVDPCMAVRTEDEQHALVSVQGIGIVLLSKKLMLLGGRNEGPKQGGKSQSRTAEGRAPACTSDAGARKVGRRPVGSVAPILDGRAGGFPPAYLVTNGQRRQATDSGRKAAAPAGRKRRQPFLEENRSEAESEGTRSTAGRGAMISYQVRSVFTAWRPHQKLGEVFWIIPSFGPRCGRSVYGSVKRFIFGCRVDGPG